MNGLNSPGTSGPGTSKLSFFACLPPGYAGTRASQVNVFWLPRAQNVQNVPGQVLPVLEEELGSPRCHSQACR